LYPAVELEGLNSLSFFLKLKKRFGNDEARADIQELIEEIGAEYGVNPEVILLARTKAESMLRARPKRVRRRSIAAADKPSDSATPPN
jgi:hypothetical protein